MAVSPHNWALLGPGDMGKRRGERAFTAPLLAPVPIADMKMLLVGKECPHTKEKSSGKQNKVSTSHYTLALHRGPSVLPSPSGEWVLVVGGWCQVGWFPGASGLRLETSWVFWGTEEEAGRQLLP